MTALAQLALALAAIPALFCAVNLFFYRRLPGGSSRPAPLSVLIPARNEEAQIAGALESVLANAGDFEVIVLDDHSADRTADIVARIAMRDRRVRLEPAPALPPGWSGKQHACHVLAGLARHELMVFIDADVRLAPDALRRMTAFMDSKRAGLASGFPLQFTETLAEKLAVPVIHFLLLGYLPMFALRFSGSPALGAGCGQLMLARRDAYFQAGGHAAIRASLHDGIKLPRAFRAHGIMTELFDATDIATCRMYAGAGQVWSGFAKNATEGMATPIALPVWTMLLFGGHVLPFLILAASLFAEIPPEAMRLALVAGAVSLGTRVLLAVRFRQSMLGALLHPLGILLTLAIQVYALWRARSGRSATWRGRSYQTP